MVYKNNLLFNVCFNMFFRPQSELDEYLNGLLTEFGGSIFFVQIGANDGMEGDPFYKFIKKGKWQGLLIEPQETVFQKLKNNYSKSNGMILENVAISDKAEVRTLYKISFSNSRQATGISSFFKRDVENLLDAGYAAMIAKQENIELPESKDEWITTEDVRCVTLDSLLVKHGITKIDLLIIDAEGYDLEIIKAVPFYRIKPNVVIYEHSHFNEFTRTESVEVLSRIGYRIRFTPEDAIAELL